MEEKHHDYSNQKCFKSISKLLDYEFSVFPFVIQYESKDSTREELYEDVFKYKTNLRKENLLLKREIEQTKESILSKALGLYFAELKELSETNQKLREQHRLIYETKKPILTQMEDNLNSPINTSKSRRAFANIHQNDNNFSKLGILRERQIENTLAPIPRKSLNDENYDSLRPSRVYGRNSLKTSQAPRRNIEQFTERKKNSTQFMGNIENDISTFSECHSSRASQKSGSRAISFEEKSKNLFTSLIENMLEEERLKEKEIKEILEDNNKNFGKAQEEIFVEDLQEEVLKTTNSIENLQKVLSNYETEIKYMQCNLTSVTDMTKQLSKVKDNYLLMQEKCKSIGALKVEIATQARKLQEIKQTSKMEYFEPPSSIKVMLRLFGVEDESMSDPSKCKQQIKNLVRGTMEKPAKRRVKVKELLDTIREGRKKFKELMSVYEAKIKKLEKKLVSFRSESKQL